MLSKSKPKLAFVSRKSYQFKKPIRTADSPHGNVSIVLRGITTRSWYTCG